MYQESKEFAYLIGVYLGDGSTTIKLDKKFGNKYRFQLGSIDKDFVDYVSYLLNIFGYHTTRWEKRYNSQKWNDMYYLNVCSKELVLYLRKITRNKKVIPKWIFKRKDWKIEFVNGLLDSEGWVGKAKVNDTACGYKYSVGINTTSNYVYKVVDILKEYGVLVSKEYSPKLKKGKHTHWFQFNLVSFIESPFKFRIERKVRRLKEYQKTKIKRDSKYYSELGKRGAKARWSK